MNDDSYSADDLRDFALFCRQASNTQLDGIIEKEREADRGRCLLIAELELEARNR